MKPFCEAHGLEYHEVPFFEANVELVSSLKNVANKCRKMGLQSVGGLRATQVSGGEEHELPRTSYATVL